MVPVDTRSSLQGSNECTKAAAGAAAGALCTTPADTNPAAAAELYQLSPLRCAADAAAVCLLLLHLLAVAISTVTGVYHFLLCCCCRNFGGRKHAKNTNIAHKLHTLEPNRPYSFEHTDTSSFTHTVGCRPTRLCHHTCTLAVSVHCHFEARPSSGRSQELALHCLGGLLQAVRLSLPARLNITFEG